MNLKWNTYYHDTNKQEIITFNIFDHGRFKEDVCKHLKKYKDKDEFAKQLRLDLFYYFGCKCEYEVLVSAWCGGNGCEDIKVDIYSQVMLNWDVFLNYVYYSNKKSNNISELYASAFADQSGLMSAT